MKKKYKLSNIVIINHMRNDKNVKNNTCKSLNLKTKLIFYYLGFLFDLKLIFIININLSY